GINQQIYSLPHLATLVFAQMQSGTCPNAMQRYIISANPPNFPSNLSYLLWQPHQIQLIPQIPQEAGIPFTFTLEKDNHSAKSDGMYKNLGEW
ncbi:MAG: hypothetical protein J1E63_06615, partial [Muribaculaceae bacterium]|nr:hypothetical protein [Muribaculaceae bacterium]